MNTKSSLSAQNMATLFHEMRMKEARNYLEPHLKELRTKHTGGTGEIRKRDLQQLACHWKLHKVPGFWTDNQTEEDLLRTLYKHAKRLAQPAVTASQPVIQQEARRVSVQINEESGGSKEDWKQTLASLRSDANTYSGDLFGTRGSYDGGLIYASRRPPPPTVDEEEDESSKSRDASQWRESLDQPEEEVSSEKESKRTKQASSALEQLKLNSTATLYKLSTQEQHQAELANDKAISTVYNMWRKTDNPDIKRNCALTLTNLFTTITMDRDDVLAPVLELAGTEHDSAIVATCARALLNRFLADRPIDFRFVNHVVTAIRMMKARADAITMRSCAQILMLLLRPGKVRPRNSPDGTSTATAEETKHQVHRAAASEGILQIIAFIAGHSDNDDCLEYCSAALLELTDVTTLHNDLSSRAILPVVISMLQSNHQATADNASLIIYELCASPDEFVSTRLVGNDKVVECLMGVAIGQAQLLNDQDPADGSRKSASLMHLGSRATAALLRLTNEAHLLSVMVQCGVAEALFSWFRHGDDMIKHHCVMALCNLFGCEAGQKALVGLGFVRIIIAAADLKTAATPAHGHSGGLEDPIAAEAAAEGIDLGVRKRCSAALRMLSSGGEPLAVHLLEEQAIAALVKLSATIDPEVRLNCVQALHALTEHPVTHPAMLQYGAIKVFIDFSRSKDPEVQQACTLGLCNLCRTADSHYALFDADVIGTLVRLVGVTGLKVEVVSAFCKLSAFRPCHPTIIKGGVLPMLIAQSRFSQAQARRECAQALYNLSVLPGSEAALLAHGVPSALTIVALFRADDGLTKDLCAAALFNLMFDPAGRQQLMDDGVLWAFIKLALVARSGQSPSPTSPSRSRLGDMDDSELMDAAVDHGDGGHTDTGETCTRLIRNLACEEDMVKHTCEKKTLTALAKFATTSNRRTRMNAVATLGEIARRQYLHAMAVDRGVVQVLNRLAVNVDIDIALGCVTVLNRLSVKPEIVTSLASMETVIAVLRSVHAVAIAPTCNAANEGAHCDGLALFTGQSVKPKAADGPVQRPHVQLSFDEKVDLVCNAVTQLLAQMSTVKQHMVALVHHGMLDLLGAIFGPGQRVCQRVPVLIQAVAIVHNVSQDTEAVKLLAAAPQCMELVQRLLSLVASDNYLEQSGDFLPQVQLLQACVNLTTAAPLAKPLLHREAFRTILHLSAKGVADHQRAAALLLANIVSVVPNPADSWFVAVVPQLLAAWSACASRDVAPDALDAFCHMFARWATDASLLAKLIELDAVSVWHSLVTFLISREAVGVPRPVRDALLLEITRCLHSVCSVESLQGIMVSANGLATLVELARQPISDIQIAVAASFELLSQKHELRVKLVTDRDAVPVLIEIANNQSVPVEAQEGCAQVLKNLSDDSSLAHMSNGDDSVVASVLRLLPPTSDLPLGSSAPSFSVDEPRRLVKSELRGSGNLLPTYPQPWPEALFTAAPEVAELDKLGYAVAEWDKIADHEGLPQPMADPREDVIQLAAPPSPGIALGAKAVGTPVERRRSSHTVLPPLDRPGSPTTHEGLESPSMSDSHSSTLPKRGKPARKSNPSKHPSASPIAAKNARGGNKLAPIDGGHSTPSSPARGHKK